MTGSSGLSAPGRRPTIRLYGPSHTIAKFLIAEGEDARTVADRLGHVRIPTKAITQSEGRRARNPIEADHLIRAMAITLVGA